MYILVIGEPQRFKKRVIPIMKIFVVTKKKMICSKKFASLLSSNIYVDPLFFPLLYKNRKKMLGLSNQDTPNYCIDQQNKTKNIVLVGERRSSRNLSRYMTYLLCKIQCKTRPQVIQIPKLTFNKISYRKNYVFLEFVSSFKNSVHKIRLDANKKTRVIQSIQVAKSTTTERTYYITVPIIINERKKKEDLLHTERKKTQKSSDRAVSVAELRGACFVV